MLADHQVAYIIVGGVGGRLQGTPVTTGDLDIVPDPALDNLHRLAAALSGPQTRILAGTGRYYEARARLAEHGDHDDLDPDALDVTHPPEGAPGEPAADELRLLRLETVDELIGVSWCLVVT